MGIKLRVVRNDTRSKINEKTYTIGDTQYWKRSGKCYSWTSSGGRVEISEDEYTKAIMGGGSPEIKKDPSVDNKVTSSDTTTSAVFTNGDTIDVDMNGRKYKVSLNGTSGEDLAKKYNDIAKHSPGRAIQWLKKSGATITKDNNVKTYTDDEKNDIYNKWKQHQKSNGMPEPEGGAKGYTDDTYSTWEKVLSLDKHNSDHGYGASKFTKVLKSTPTENGTIDTLQRDNGTTIYGTTYLS